MSDEDRHHGTPVESSLDYKTLFLGACSVIVLLGGAAFRFWDTSNQRSTDRAYQILDKLGERVAELEAGSKEYRFRIEHLERALEKR